MGRCNCGVESAIQCGMSLVCGREGVRILEEGNLLLYQTSISSGSSWISGMYLKRLKETKNLLALVSFNLNKARIEFLEGYASAKPAQ